MHFSDKMDQLTSNRFNQQSDVNELTSITPAHDRPSAIALPLAKRVRAALSWNVSGSVIIEITRFVRSVVLARILVPEDFGLFGMALTVMAAFNALSTLGFTRTIVTNNFETKAEIKAHLNTIWSLELVRSLLTALLIAASAFPLSHFYRQPQLKIIIPVLGLVTLVQGLQNTGMVLLRKEISFARIFWYEVATNAIGVGCSIVLASIMRNVWALVLGLFVTALVGTALSYVIHSHRPQFRLEPHVLRSALHLGKLTLVIAAASYLMNMADNVVVGRTLGPRALGNYSLAFNIASTPISVLVVSITAVMFPTSAHITTHRPHAIETALTKVVTLSLFIMVAIAVALFLVSVEVVRLFFGSKWTSAGIVLRILALVIPLRGLSLITSAVLLGMNRLKYVALATTTEAVVFVAILYPLMRSLGLIGAAWAGMIAYAVGCVTRLVAANIIIPGIAAKLVRNLLFILVAGAIGLVAGEFSLQFLSEPVSRVITAGAVATVIPSLIVFSFKSEWRKWLIEWLS